MGKITRHVLTAACWSAMSCGLTLAMLMPKSLHATSPDSKAEISQPKFVSDGVALTMRLDDERRIELTATNQTDQPAVARPRFECKSLSMSDPMSRVPRPRRVWTHEESITLAPNETKRITFPATLAINSGDSIVVTTDSRKDGAVLLTLLTLGQ